MPRHTPNPKLDALTHIKDEWNAHTRRHRRGGSWGTFRGVVSVLQVAGTFVLLTGFAAQSTSLSAALRNSEWGDRVLLDPSELMVLALLIVPEWLDILFFGIADRTLRASGLLKDPIQYDPQPVRASVGSLQALWFAQVISRVGNLLTHVAMAAIVSTAFVFVLRGMWRGLRPLV